MEVHVKRLITLAMTALLLAAAPVAAGQSDKPKKHHGDKDAAAIDAGTHVTVVFGTRDIELVRRHYESRFSSLPPGLQKKVARGGSLPPGWQKKIEPFPVALERELSPLPAGYSRGVFDAHAVIYNSKGTIIDVAVLF